MNGLWCIKPFPLVKIFTIICDEIDIKRVASFHFYLRQSALKTAWIGMIV